MFDLKKSYGWVTLTAFILGLEASLLALSNPTGFFMNIIPGLILAIIAMSIRENVYRKLAIASLVINVMAFILFVSSQILFNLWIIRAG